MSLCEHCGKDKGKGWRCGFCTEEGEPKAYLIIANMVCDDLFPGSNDIVNKELLASYILDVMPKRYRCPVCFSELPNYRRGTAAGDTENYPGDCPRCSRKCPGCDGTGVDPNGQHGGRCCICNGTGLGGKDKVGRIKWEDCKFQQGPQTDCGYDYYECGHPGITTGPVPCWGRSDTRCPNAYGSWRVK